MEKALSQFYLQDSRSNTGDGLMFWALGAATPPTSTRPSCSPKSRPVGTGKQTFPGQKITSMPAHILASTTSTSAWTRPATS